MYDLLNAAINNERDNNYSFFLQGDLCQMATQRLFLSKCGFDLKQNNVYQGYRQEVHLDKSDEDNYCSYLIGKGWFEMSLTLQIAMMDKTEHEKLYTWLNLAKKQYPKAFKHED